MARFFSLLLWTLPAFTAVSAQSTVPVFGQCGGENYNGPTTCAAGSVCVIQNPFYSQCVPGDSGGLPPSTTTATTTTVSTPTAAPTGFVKTSGIHFTLNGKPFTVVGANSYWVGLMNYGIADMNTAFHDIAATGASVCRTWGFNEVTTPDGVAFYQSWSGSTPTINLGANGLENFDNVVAAAKANGLRLIVTLTNNWSDYGGMDVYVNQLLGQGQPHDFFYTNPTVIAAYKNYVKTFVTRYLNEPAILAWELANEPRCLGSTSASSGNCSISTISTWAAEMSAFIKSIDSNHLVAIGDEGFINDPGNPIFVYQGSSPSLGIDFATNLNISTLDFGTFHLYPDSWGEPANPFGTQWIEDHATAMTASNKPIIMEEFGITLDEVDVYGSWYSAIESTNVAGDLIWQAGSILSNGESDPNGAVFPGSAVYILDTQHAAALRARDGDPQ
ncbi:glycoside hydrolase family 5 protein [Collybiopsis luxurians FD-317 M1]|uniref:mannan endo-1,4-beta-mannosidase n=1 Tax=Collybiopsis luxurians FD-317 M1 TaxID=944289 RepID=A0A0D0C3G9_9AGAR|nr:glycoside hydrolase family 5 protein [Collybiopsis luxurians FD-317 M1]